MPLILRTNLSRPLSHPELDGNFSYLRIIPWVKQGYEVGQFVTHVVSGTTESLYRCVTTHNDYPYSINGDQFVVSYLDPLTSSNVVLWRSVGGSSSGSGGTSSLDVGYTGTTVEPTVSFLDTDEGIIAKQNGTLGQARLETIYNTKLDPALTTPNAVGGIPAGTTAASLSSRSLVGIVDDLLFPTVLPTYSIPSISISGVGGGLAEVGAALTPTVTATGVENDAGPFTTLRIYRNGSAISSSSSLSSGTTTNVPAQFGYADPNNPNLYYQHSFADNYTIPALTGGNTSNSTSYYVDGDYNAGVAKKNNKGSLDVRSAQVRSSDAPQAASANYASGAVTYSGIYPYFWGVSTSLPTASSIAADIAAGNANKVLANAESTVTIVFGAASQYLWYAQFANHTDKTKWYVDALNNGSIGGASNLFNTPIIQSVNSPSSLWSGISFEIYISNYQTSTFGNMELRNS